MKRLLPPCVTALTGVLFLLGLQMHAADWPHWLGPNGDNIAPEPTGFNPDLSEWKVAWKANVGRGYSAVSVAGGRAVTLGHNKNKQETVYCFDATSGNLLWKHAYDAKLMSRMHPGGPNATPTIVNDRVITISKDGQVFNFGLQAGEILWRTNLLQAADVKKPYWGFASSPVIEGDRIFFSAGKVIVLGMNSGETLWTSGTAHKTSYATVVLFEREGERFIAALNAKSLSVLSAIDGREIAQHPFKSGFNITATTPIVLSEGKRIFISGTISSLMLGFDGRELSSSWKTKHVRNEMNNSVILGNVLYGIDGKEGSKSSRFVCVNLTDGKVNWAREKFGFGTTIGIGQKMLLALTERGELVTIEPSLEGYKEVSRRQVLGKTCWTTPVYANDRIYVRNDRGQVICFSAVR